MNKRLLGAKQLQSLGTGFSFSSSPSEFLFHEWIHKHSNTSSFEQILKFVTVDKLKTSR